jgi:tetratricopeptide (TPR) repeat protein
MNADTRVTPEPLSLIRRVDAVCCRFERAWREGGRPRVEDFLADLPEPERGPLLRELVLLDADYRRRTGDSPEPNDYLSRFPALDATCLAAVGTARQADGDSPGGGVRYRVLRPHAQGGLGVVYVALDRELGREVALKEILPDRAADAHSRSRFVFEAEVTGSLEHPGVVPVYGLGAYADGRPFYAMRLIQGDSLQEAIRQFHEADRPGRDPGARSLEFRQLLRRFVDVCNAVAYAHSRGFVHRDLKPANIMLGPFGETLVVDWGMAKAVPTASEPSRPEGPARVAQATGPGPGGSADLSHSGMVLGSPAYMSPEQAARRHGDVGPASDVYGLGATLFHLLTGRAAVEGGGLVEMLRRVQHGEVPPARQVNPGVPAALEAVCRKAMALRPADRYATALELAADVEHWLADEPVAAYPEGWSARARRWLRRHRGAAATGAAALAAVAVLLGGASVALNRARQSEQLAREAAQRSERQAQTARGLAEAEAGFLIEMFRSLDPKRTGREVRLFDVLDQAARRLEGQTAHDPVLHARLLGALGQTYHSLGMHPKAAGLLEQARELCREHLGADHPESLRAATALAVAYLRAERTDQAVALLGETVKRMTALHGPDHPDTLGAVAELVGAYRSAGRRPEAHRLAEEALARARAALGSDHPATVLLMTRLGTLDSRRDMRIALNEEAHRRTEARLGTDHPDTLACRVKVGLAYYRAGRLADAAEVYVQALPRLRKFLGDEHPETLQLVSYLANSYRYAGRFADAEPLYQEMREAERRKSTPDSLTLGDALTGIAACLLARGRPAEAEPLLCESLDVLRGEWADHHVFLNAQSLLGAVLVGQGRYAEAEPLLLASVQELSKPTLTYLPGPVHAALQAEALDPLIAVYEATGRSEQAAPWRAKKAALQPAGPPGS